jgi:hypothetical protein
MRWRVRALCSPPIKASKRSASSLRAGFRLATQRCAEPSDGFRNFHGCIVGADQANGTPRGLDLNIVGFSGVTKKR